MRNHFQLISKLINNSKNMNMNMKNNLTPTVEYSKNYHLKLSFAGFKTQIRNKKWKEKANEMNNIRLSFSDPFWVHSRKQSLKIKYIWMTLEELKVF